jgi:hypothetical protein
MCFCPVSARFIISLAWDNPSLVYLTNTLQLLWLTSVKYRTASNDSTTTWNKVVVEYFMNVLVMTTKSVPAFRITDLQFETFLPSGIWRRVVSSVCHLPSSCFLGWLILRPWRWKRYIPSKQLLTFNGLHGVLAHKIEFFHNHRCENLKP